MKNPIVKKIIWCCILAILIFSLFFIWTDFQKNLETLKSFPWLWLPVILISVLINFLIRELKWEYYRRVAGVQAPRLGSFLVFFSGFSMAISPGRVGELIKPFMYKEYFNQKMRKTIPLVFCERLSDLLGMIALAGLTVVPYMSRVSSAGLPNFSPNLITGFLALSVVFMALLIWLARRKRWAYQILLKLGRHKRFSHFAHKARRMYHATYPLLTFRNLAVTTAMAAVSWSFECIALWLIMKGVGAPEVTLLESTFVFCMATVFGGFLFFLPGGLGGFEPSMTLMLAWLGVAGYKAVPAIFIIRLSTLFFGVALGFIFILVTSARYHKRMMWEEFEHVEEDSEA
jgi:glycosyltransferase 2 family protein